MQGNEARKELMSLLSARSLAPDEILSVSMAVAREEHTRALIAFLREKEDATVDEIFQRAGEIAFGKNS